MEVTLAEIAAVLRSTEDMAAQFAKRVESRVGQAVPHAEILVVMKKLPPKSLSLDKVVAKVQQQRKRTGRQKRSTRSARSTTQTAAARKPSVAKSEQDGESDAEAAVSSGAPKTILERLEATLVENWDRAEKDGLSPNRLSASAFVSAVYQYTDRRTASRRRILQAAQELDRSDVVLTPALVADAAQRLFEA